VSVSRFLQRRSGTEKTFLVGAGCQKGGTTWLFRYLKESPQFVRGYMKEYHVFDALDLESEDLTRNRIMRRAEEALAAARSGEPIDARVLHRLSMYGNPNLYYDYFSGLLMTRPDGRLTADMTPDYGMLPAARFRDIKEGFASRGVRTVSIFLMRDPVERIWSHIRMQDQRFPNMFDQPPHEVLRERHAAANYAMRTRYDRTIAALDEVFDPSEVYYGFYEDLFSEERMREICSFLGIDFVRPDFDQRRNASERPVEPLAEEIVKVVASHFGEVYDAVATRFPDVDLGALWPSARHVL
jgi:hypothetical protein